MFPSVPELVRRKHVLLYTYSEGSGTGKREWREEGDWGGGMGLYTNYLNIV